MELIKRHNDMPSWAQSFLSTFEEQYCEDMERQAAINVKTLPKVVWNDNTFYVSLDADEGSADVFNEYGNVVTALKGVASIEDVESRLNKQIVADITNNVKTAEIDKTQNSKQSRLEQKLINTKVIKLDDELNNVAQVMQKIEGKNLIPSSALVITADVETEMPTDDPSINKSVNTVTNTPTSSTQDTVDEQLDEAEKQNTASKSTLSAKYASAKIQSMLNMQQKANQELKIRLANNSKALKDHRFQTKNLKQELNTYKAKFVKLQNKVEKLASVVEQLNDQIHAYINPGNVYDIQAEQKEVEHFNATAAHTQRAIDIEHGVDLTVPYGRISLQNQILQNNIELPPPDAVLVRPAESIETVKRPNNIKVEVVNVDNSQDNVRQEELPEINEINNDVEIIDSPVKENIKVKKLGKTASNQFKTRVCPICGSRRSLSLTDGNDLIQNVICNECKSKFYVDLNNEDIFSYI